MEIILPLIRLNPEDITIVGGKASSLAILLKNSFDVPLGYVITTVAFDEFLRYNRLREKINLELSRKLIENMRWEELWDASLRIKNMIIKGRIPHELRTKIEAEITKNKNTSSWVVRSSSLAEDSHSSSFAGLHESYVNIRGIENLFTHVKLVWASLYSDGALMYRKELNLELSSMSMAVIIQEFIPGESSGICFSVNPMNDTQAIVESVNGLNQALVDGDIDPDRWVIERSTGRIIEHKIPSRAKQMVPAKAGVTFQDIKEYNKLTPPLSDHHVLEVYTICRQTENLFQAPQDMEWTKSEGQIIVLQSRPITRTIKKEKDQRSWYLSLKRTFNNLEDLKKKIELDLIPQLIKTTENLEKIDIYSKSDKELSQEIIKRKELLDYWNKTYWEEFIPFAHGMRLFGSVYNERIKPKDPYEFMMLLQGQNLEAIKRNYKLREISNLSQENDRTLKDKELRQNKLNRKIDEFIQKFPEIMVGGVSPQEMKTYVKRIANELRGDMTETWGKEISKLEQTFYSSFPKNQREYATRILDIGRASYRLRDNDNIYIGRLERCLEKTMEIGLNRLKGRFNTISLQDIHPLEVAQALADYSYKPNKPKKKKQKKRDHRLHVNQIVGQPASKGMTSGFARVVEHKKDLFNLKKGEILVIDAIDPTMTFVIPLCAGIIERRGGMLIHGAIIAREYNIPCVTGIADATQIIKTGDFIHLDGENGIVAIRQG